MLNATFQDPVKYPDNMSLNFKSFLKGLLNKVGLWFMVEVKASFSWLILTLIYMASKMAFQIMKNRYHKID